MLPIKPKLKETLPPISRLNNQSSLYRKNINNSTTTINSPSVNDTPIDIEISLPTELELRLTANINASKFNRRRYKTQADHAEYI